MYALAFSRPLGCSLPPFGPPPLAPVGGVAGDATALSHPVGAAPPAQYLLVVGQHQFFDLEVEPGPLHWVQSYRLFVEQSVDLGVRVAQVVAGSPREEIGGTRDRFSPQRKRGGACFPVSAVS